MKQILAITLILLTGITFGQRDLTPSSKKQAFGQRDFRKLGKTGLQFQLGPAYSFTKRKTSEADFNNGSARGNYVTDPGGRIGVYAELGLAHIPKKSGFISYYDWGLGFKYLGGKEKTEVNYTDIAGNVISSEEQSDGFYNGYVYARFSLHKEITFKKAENIVLDNSLGFNVDYRVITADQSTDYANYASQFATDQYYHQPFVAQLHYGLGFRIKLRRGTYLIPGFRLPILGIQEWNKGKSAHRWFSSKYYPVLFQIKIINFFKKKNKSKCPAVETNEEDRKRNKEYMQGN
ncbi:MAG: hypothetical protein ACI865_000310 [Flavobacteriaceae bacterium]|jgi:hypothetical protein